MKLDSYNQTLFLESLTQLPDNGFTQEQKDIIKFLLDLSYGNLEFNTESLLAFDMSIVDKLEEFIDSALRDNGMDKENPLRELLRCSELKTSLSIMKVRKTCVQDTDFF